jgi:hypothetical protein
VSNLHLDATAQDFLRETSKWAYFLSILGFVGIGLMVLASLFFASFSSSLPIDGFEYGGFLFAALYMIIALAYFFPIYYLYQFSRGAKVAVMENSSASLTESLGSLKSHYKFIGIFTVVILSMYFLIFIFAMIAGVAGLMM